MTVARRARRDLPNRPMPKKSGPRFGSVGRKIWGKEGAGGSPKHRTRGKTGKRQILYYRKTQARSSSASLVSESKAPTASPSTRSLVPARTSE